MERLVIPGTHSQRPREGREALHRPGGGLQEQGEYPGMVRPSLYTKAAMHPALTSALVVGGGMLMRAVLGSAARRRSRLWSTMGAVAMLPRLRATGLSRLRTGALRRARTW
jgi:hypothetical protein